MRNQVRVIQKAATWTYNRPPRGIRTFVFFRNFQFDFHTVTVTTTPSRTVALYCPKE